MPKYEISDNVKENIFKLLNRVDIKGHEAPVIVEIVQCLSIPVKRKEGKDEKKERKDSTQG